jgi:hypothetical protein
VLAAFEAKKEAEFIGRLHCNTEIEMITMLISTHNRLKVGPGRAGDLLAEHLDVKMQIADEIVKDDDPELIYTKRNLAVCLKSILGPDNWDKYKTLFPLLREYW